MALRMTWTDEETQIRELIEDRADAARAKNVDAVFAHTLPTSWRSTRWVSCSSREQMRTEALGRMHVDVPPVRWSSRFTTSRSAQGDLAFGHYLSRCGGTGPDDKERSGWLRATFCCRKTNGSWRIVHEHFSAPFDPESGKGSVDLVP